MFVPGRLSEVQKLEGVVTLVQVRSTTFMIFDCKAVCVVCAVMKVVLQ